MVRSISAAGLTSMPAAASRANVAVLARSIVTPRLASGSTTMVAPPAVVVTMPTRLRPLRSVTGTRKSSGNPSIKPSSVSTRAMPQALRNVSAMSNVWITEIPA